MLPRMLAINLTVTLQYRGDFFLMQLRNLVTPLVSLLVWEAALTSGATLPVSPGYLVSYFILVSVVGMLTSSWTAYYLAESIRLGDLARRLVRSASTHWEGIANNIDEKLIKLVLLAPMIIVLALMLNTVISPNLSRMTRYVAHGELDLVLMRPVSAQAYTLVRWIQPAELTGVVTGAAVMITGLWRAQLRPSPLEIVAAVCWFVLGLVAIGCLWSNIAYLAFRITSVDPVELLLDLLACGRYPQTFFPRLARAGLTFVIPVGICTTFPVQALAGAVHPGWLAVAVASIAAAALLTRLHWRSALRRYSSASS